MTAFAVAVPYVLRRGNRFHFRRVVPQRLARRLGRREVKVALGTCDLTIARRRARELANAFEEAMEMVEANPRLDRGHIDALVRAYMARQWAVGERDVLAPDHDPEREASDADEGVEELGRRIRHNLVDGSTRRAVREVLRGDVPAEDSDAYRYAANAVMRAQRETLRLRAAMFRGQYLTPIDPLFAGVTPQEVQPAAPPLTLSEVLNRWAEERQPARKSLVEFERAVRRFRELHGDLDVTRIEKSHVRDFKDALVKLPTSFPKSLREAPLPEVVKLTEGQDIPRASAGSVNKAVGAVHTLLGWSVDNGYLDANVAHGIRVKGKPAQSKRLPYSTDDLKRIFTTPVFAQGHRPKGGAGEAAKWLPILALYTGARLSELGQLDISDVRCEAGIWFLDLNSTDNKSLKTASSHRRVPLHSDVMEAGFIEYVSTQKSLDPNGKVFPQLQPDGQGNIGGRFSKWWRRYTRKYAGISDPAKVFHSFRHTFKDACRAAGVPEDVHDALTGHSGGGVGRSYGMGHDLASLRKAIQKLSFEVLAYISAG